MTTITAEIIADSVNEQGNRLTTMLLRYPRCIHAEFMTHRDFSRNAASSRAIPVKKLIQDVLDNPFVPLVWGKNQKGMQGGEEWKAMVPLRIPVEGKIHEKLTTTFFRERFLDRTEAWLALRDRAVEGARAFGASNYAKQIVNRLLEPFAHITVVVSATRWSNFFALRDHEDAEPHIRILAMKMRDAMDLSTPKLLKPGDWHLPFVTEIDRKASLAWANENRPSEDQCGRPEFGWGIRFHDAGVPFYLEAGERLKKLSVARCASTSYKTVDGFDMTMDRAIELHDKLVAAAPLHASPCEHQATPDEPALGHERPVAGWKHAEQHGNFTGWRQYRKTLLNECL